MTGDPTSWNGRTARLAPGPAAPLLTLVMLMVSSPAPAQGPATSYRWSLDVPATGTLIIDLPPGWEPDSPQGGDGLADWQATTRSRCVMFVHVVGSQAPDPAFNGPAALEEFVRRKAEAFLPDAIEGRYTIVPLRGAEAGGYYFALRERVPRRRETAYLTQGAVGLGNLRAEFTVRSPAPDLADVQKALKALAAARFDRLAIEGGTQ
jgi:hypothetical protein